MDERSFDAFTRGLTANLPRRRTIAMLAGAVSSLLARGVPPVAAACKKVGKKCDKNKDCCDGARCKGDKKDKKREMPLQVRVERVRWEVPEPQQ